VAGDARHLAIYYITPWIRWDRGPYAPDQAVLVDLANRRFYMFGIEIWPHEFYFVAGLLIMAGSACSSSPARWAAPGAAMPARRRCGPTCSSTSTA
jgi:polyferredoxin